MPETIFISYRSLDSAKVDPIVTRLRALENPDGTRRYRVWQDKNRDGDGVPPGADWWESIVDAIIECRVFIFMMSAESVKNDNCRAELSYAYARNRHILPIVLNGEFFYNASGKEDIRYMKDVPQELHDLRAQFLFDNGQQAYKQLEAVLADWMANPRRDVHIPRPKDPSKTNDDSNDFVLLYDEACDFAWRLEFETAERKFRQLMRRTGHDFEEDVHQWVEILVEYKQLISLDSRISTRHRVPERWQTYRQKYAGRSFMLAFNPEGLFDPKGFQATADGNGGNPPQTPVRTTFSSSTPEPIIETPPPPQIFTPPIPSFLPQPFEWCKITGGKVTLVPDDIDKKESYLKRNTVFTIPDFYMAKYPVTNAQYQAFVDAPDGYNNPEWWNYSEGAKAWRKANPKPEDTAFTGDNHPRTNITWYESVAFTLWLSQKLDVNIHLPTDEQWQRAAIGDKNWAYPYGDTFDENRCNFNTRGTTPVTQYPNGASPFGVMDMSGNVWEWCYTSYDKGNIPLKDAVDERTYVLRGGSWWNDDTYLLRADVRYRSVPFNRDLNRGMRFACSY